MGDSDSDSDDSQFASPQAITPSFFRSQAAASPRPRLPPSLKPPSFAATPEDLPPQKPPSPSTSEPISSSAISTALDSLSRILPGPLPASATAALYDTPTTYALSCLLRAPNSGSGDNPLCRWLYETFQSGEHSLQLLVLRFVPLLAGVYLARASTQRRNLAGFEAVLLALYSHRCSEPVTITLPELSTPSIYHEPSSSPSSSPSRSCPHYRTESVVWPALQPQGSVRATRRTAIVGVALDLYYANICWMPLASKVEFCEFLNVWAGQVDETDEVEERIALPWELLQPALKIVAHCMMGAVNGGLSARAYTTCRKLHARALHDVNPRAILVIDTLLRMVNVVVGEEEADYTELPDTRLLSI